MTTRVTELVVLMAGEVMGELHRSGQRIALRYDRAYRASPGSTPLSVGMPLLDEEHSGRRVAAYLDGLLPDNEEVRTRWARQFECPNQPFDLLAHVGEDCAGGVQFVRPERLDRLEPGEIEWLSDDDIAIAIHQLRIDPAAWLPESEVGQFSLAGAQSKFALVHDPVLDRWGRASGAVPTTHIVKPASARFPGYEINEHLSMGLAAALGLITARSRIVAFADTRAVVVARYDRVYDGERWRRVHQEDLCQALGVPPARKYESSNGPTPVRIAELLRDVVGEVGQGSVERFASALAFNWLTAGTDAHAKNYSLLLSGPQVRLAPLYDLGSALPYVSDTPLREPGTLDAARLRLAMRVGGEYAVRRVRRQHWDALAAQLKLEAGFLGRVTEMAERIPVLLERLAGDPGLGSEEFVHRYVTKLTNHARNCLHVLRGRPPRGWS